MLIYFNQQINLNYFCFINYYSFIHSDFLFYDIINFDFFNLLLIIHQVFYSIILIDFKCFS